MDFNNYDPVADLYDIYVPATYDIDFFVKEAQKVPGEVLELMSGTGRVSIPLLEAGIKLTCVDISADLNQVFKRKLKQKGLVAQVYQMDVRQLELSKEFAMVIIPFYSFAHLTSVDDQRKALEQIYQHLQPGGRFICTLGNPTLRRQDIDGNLRIACQYPLEGQGGRLLLLIQEDFDPQDEHIVHAMQFYEEYDGLGVLKSKRMLELHFRLTTRDEFEALVIKAGFSVISIYGDYTYGDFDPESSPVMIWELEKRA